MFTAWGKLATLNKEQKISTAQLALPTFHSEPTWVSAGACAVLTCKDTGPSPRFTVVWTRCPGWQLGDWVWGEAAPSEGRGLLIFVPLALS